MLGPDVHTQNGTPSPIIVSLESLISAPALLRFSGMTQQLPCRPEVQ